MLVFAGVLGFAWPRCLEKVPNILSQMVVNDGDESHGIPIRKKITKKQIQEYGLLKGRYIQAGRDSQSALVFSMLQKKFPEQNPQGSPIIRLFLQPSPNIFQV